MCVCVYRSMMRPIEIATRFFSLRGRELFHCIFDVMTGWLWCGIRSNGSKSVATPMTVMVWFCGLLKNGGLLLERDFPPGHLVLQPFLLFHLLSQLVLEPVRDALVLDLQRGTKTIPINRPISTNAKDDVLRERRRRARRFTRHHSDVTVIFARRRKRVYDDISRLGGPIGSTVFSDGFPSCHIILPWLRKTLWRRSRPPRPR